MKEEKAINRTSWFPVNKQCIFVYEVVYHSKPLYMYYITQLHLSIYITWMGADTLMAIIYKIIKGKPISNGLVSEFVDAQR